jgi:hypothetical protein
MMMPPKKWCPQRKYAKVGTSKQSFANTESNLEYQKPGRNSGINPSLLPEQS